MIEIKQQPAEKIKDIEQDFDLIIKPSLWMVGDISLTSIKTSKELNF